MRSNNLVLAASRIGIGTHVPQFGLHLYNKDFAITDLANLKRFYVTTAGHVTASKLSITDATNTKQFEITGNGEVTARKIQVNTNIIPDYVFEDDYDLLTIQEVEAFINKYGHLPKIKSALEYEKIGTVDLGE